MTLTYGFYNSVSSDRLYDAVLISKIFDGIIEDGVFASIGDHLLVSPGTGMQVLVGTGRAWFNHTWSYNDASVALSIASADPTLPRIDVVALEINAEVATRANSLKVITGTPASTPVAPDLTNTSEIHQYALAHVSVPAAITQILGSHITNKVGTDLCPFVTGPLSVISAEDLLAQWHSEWHEWFDFVVNELSSEQFGNLQNQIIAVVGDVNPPLIDLLTLKTHTHHNGINGGLIPATAFDDYAIGDIKIGNRVAKLKRRKGGSSTHWNTQGTTDYTPFRVQMQCGVVSVHFQAGLLYSDIGSQIDFGLAFPYKPIMQLSVYDSNGTGQRNYSTVIRALFENYFVAQAFRTVDTGAVDVDIHWLAIGPEL